MGNKFGSDYGVSRGEKVLPYEINLIDMNYEANINGIQFQQSVYNIEYEKFNPQPFVDKRVRDSMFSMVQMPKLSEVSKPIIEKYVNKRKEFEEYQFALVNKTWRITKYEMDGHFLAHCDRQKLLVEHKHIGTQIFIPPKSQFTFQGGELTLEYNGKYIDILPHQKKWTHLILPLGIQHQVKNVKRGMRISYVKEIWLKQQEEQIQTDQDREKRQKEQYRQRDRRREVMRVD